MIITFEGPDGAGKSTIVGELKKKIDFCQVRNFTWNKNKELQNYYKKLELNNAWEAERILFLSSGFFLTKIDEIKRNEKEGIVIFDRYIDTAYVKDYLRGVPPELIDIVYSSAPKANLVFYVFCDEKVQIDRLINRENKISFWDSGIDVVEGLSFYEAKVKYQESSNEELVKYTKIYQSLIKKRYEELYDDSKVIYINTTKSQVSKTVDNIITIIRRSYYND